MKPDTPSRKAAARARVDELLARNTVDVRIDRLVEGGLGFGRVEGFPLLVSRAAAGDLLRVKLTDRKRDYARADVVEVLEAGPDRIEPLCPVYDRCGGCDLQHIHVDRQAQIKADAATETLRRLGGIEVVDARVLTGQPFGYRARAQLQVRGQGNELDIGFFERGSNQLVPTTKCPVLVDGLERRMGPILVSLRGESEAALALEQASSPEPAETDAEADTDAEVGPKKSHPIPSRLDLLLGDDDDLTTAPATESLPHRPVIRRVGDYDYELDARCFFQGHVSLVSQLVDVAIGSSSEDEASEETVFELHAGVGLFSLPLAARHAHVYSVESDRIAGRYLTRNAKRNKLSNITAVPVSAEHFLKELFGGAQRASAGAGETPPRAERWFFDPPRTGLSKDLVNGACRLRPKHITYVSCQPPTLARDLKLLHRFYEVVELTYVDLFPQTAHLETVVQLRARAEPLPAPAKPERPDKDGRAPRRDKRRDGRRDGRGTSRGSNARPERKSRGPRRDTRRGSYESRGARERPSRPDVRTHSKPEGRAPRSRDEFQDGSAERGSVGSNFGGGWVRKERGSTQVQGGEQNSSRAEDKAKRGRDRDAPGPDRPPLRRRRRAETDDGKGASSDGESRPEVRGASADGSAKVTSSEKREPRKDTEKQATPPVASDNPWANARVGGSKRRRRRTDDDNGVDGE